MIVLLLFALGTTAAAVLAGGTAWRVLARRDHRCQVVSRPTTCAACADVVSGRGLGGHVVCACGAASSHLHGPDLLRWQAEHHHEVWPDLPAEGTERHRALVADPAVGALDEQGEADRRAILEARDHSESTSGQLPDLQPEADR